MAVASAGLYASLHLIPDNHANIPPLSFLQAGCPSCRPTNSVKALKVKKNLVHARDVNGNRFFWVLKNFLFPGKKLPEWETFGKYHKIHTKHCRITATATRARPMGGSIIYCHSPTLTAAEQHTAEHEVACFN